MDEFKRTTYKMVGIGGVNCPCCCDYTNHVYNHSHATKNRSKAKFRRVTRHMLKNADRLEFKQYLSR